MYLNQKETKIETKIKTKKKRKKQKKNWHLRNGSNPVMNSGQGACAEAPAGVSGQHSQPSHVPRQYVPVRREEWKDKLPFVLFKYIKLLSNQKRKECGKYQIGDYILSFSKCIS